MLSVPLLPSGVRDQLKPPPPVKCRASLQWHCLELVPMEQGLKCYCFVQPKFLLLPPPHSPLMGPYTTWLGLQSSAVRRRSTAGVKLFFLKAFLGIRDGSFEPSLSLSIVTVNPVTYLCLISCSAVAALRGVLSTPTECLTLMRRKQRTREGIVSKVLQVSAARACEQKALRPNMTKTREN